MKVFIVFCGILIINISFLSYQCDLGRYIQSQIFLKAVAEECAAGAALYYDEDIYSEGQLQFKYEECRKYIEFIINESKKRMPLPKESGITYEVSYHDDNLGYNEDSDKPSVTVALSVTTEDLFGLPFLEVRKLKRAARYELP